MKTNAFLKNLSALKEDAGIKSPSFGMSIMSSALSSNNISSLSVKIDNIISECTELITSHTKAKDVVEDYGRQTAGNKSAAAKKLEDNDTKKRNLEAEVRGLEPKIREYDVKEALRETDRARLNAYSKEIDERKKSGNNYIPFYGIKYAVDTNKMINDYNRQVNDWNVLNDWLNNNRSKWHEWKSRLYDLRSQIERLRQENDKLQKEGGDICELLTILSRLIAEFQSFLSGIKSVRNDLEFTFVKNANEMQILIDSSLAAISSYNNILQNKLTNLPNDVVQKLKPLLD